MRLNINNVPKEVITAFYLLGNEVLELNKCLYSFDISILEEHDNIIIGETSNFIYSLGIQIGEYKQFYITYRSKTNDVAVLESFKYDEDNFEYNIEDSYSLILSDVIPELSGFIKIVKNQCDKIEDERFHKDVAGEI